MKKVMGCVEIYEDFLTQDQADKIIEAVDKMDQDKDFIMGYEDAAIGKGHKGGDIRTTPHFQEYIQILVGLNLAEELFNRLGCRTHRSLGLGKMLLFVIV